MYTIFVTVKVKPSCVDEFVNACIENGQASVPAYELARDAQQPPAGLVVSRVCKAPTPRHMPFSTP